MSGKADDPWDDREEDEESEFDWDLDYQVTSHMVALGSEMMEIIRRFAPRGKELWPLVPSTLYGRFLQKRCLGYRLFVLTWDAGRRGWAALLRWWEQKNLSWVLRELLLVGTWPREQHRVSAAS